VTSALRPVPRKQTGTAPQQNGTTAEVTEFESGSFGVGLFHQKPQQYSKAVFAVGAQERDTTNKRCQ
jgi:hypothetical protein